MRSLDAPDSAISARRVEIWRSRSSVWRVALLEEALKLSATTFSATMPTRRLARAPIHRRPRVRRRTRPDSASPDNAPAVWPTARGTRRAGIGVPAYGREVRGRRARWTRVDEGRRVGDRRAGTRGLGAGAVAPRAAWVAAEAIRSRLFRRRRPSPWGSCGRHGAAPSANGGCAPPPRAWRRAAAG